MPSSTDIEEGASTRSLPDTLQSFLSEVGVVTVADNNSTHHHHDHNSENSHKEPSIFESSFDLTPERLSYVFNIFDTDEDGKISYVALRRGLEFHTNVASSQSALSEESFQQLVQLLDQDGSGDITFAEFSEGLRLLMLRHLFRQQRPTLRTAQEEEANNNVTRTEVMDFDTVRFGRHLVTDNPQEGGGDAESSTTTILGEREFYFQNRPAWVKTRWVNVQEQSSSPISASLTMKRIAVKYLLHPLALEDALSPGSHRPKAEMYTNHYFVIVPFFFIEWQVVEERASTGLLRVLPTTLWSWLGLSKRPKRRRTISSSSSSLLPKQISSIGVHMASLFVTLDNDTIISFMMVGNSNNDNNDTRNNTKINPWERVQQELELSYSKLRQYDAQYLTYAILDEAVDLMDPILCQVRVEMQDERDYLREQTHFDSLARMHALRAELEKVSQMLKPFLRLLTHVIEDDAISPGATIYLRDVRDNLEGCDETVNKLLKECQDVDAEAEKFQARQMDKTLYTLTVISAIFLPAQFLTGVWGMNFVHMPELDETWGYRMFWIVSSCMMVSLFVMLNFGRLRY